MASAPSDAPPAAARRGPAHGRKSPRRWLRRLVVAVVVIVLGVGGAVGYGVYRLHHVLDRIEKPNICGPHNIYCIAQTPNAPFNVLTIGSDSRAGLTGQVAAQTGASQVTGQRSDSVKIFHVDPRAGTISVLSIPRDTMVQLLPGEGLPSLSSSCSCNRINVNFDSGPGLLVRTIEANFGIPINHVVVVNFGGLIGSVNSLGGIWMDFPYPAKDLESGLNVPYAGCQLLNGTQALAVSRSRHFYYEQDGVWNYDGTSDFGRIDRQNQFLRALIDSAKAKYNPVTLLNFVSSLPQGISTDNWSTAELLGLALKFHSYDANAMATYTLPTYPTQVAGNDVLTVQQPDAQQMLVNVFGQVGAPGGLTEPSLPPPNENLEILPPPVVTTTTTTTTTAPPVTTTSVPHSATTTTAPVHTEPWYTFNPVACSPR